MCIIAQRGQRVYFTTILFETEQDHHQAIFWLLLASSLILASSVFAGIGLSILTLVDLRAFRQFILNKHNAHSRV